MEDLPKLALERGPAEESTGKESRIVISWELVDGQAPASEDIPNTNGRAQHDAQREARSVSWPC